MTREELTARLASLDTRITEWCERSLEEDRYPIEFICEELQPAVQELLALVARLETAETPTRVPSAPAPETPASPERPRIQLGQAWVARVTAEDGDSPSVQGAGAIERPDELVRFALDLAVATLDENGCNCHPEEPCALCVCKEAIAQLKATPERATPEAERPDLRKVLEQVADGLGVMIDNGAERHALRLMRIHVEAALRAHQPAPAPETETP